jgi:tetratricopeptide (TPR) repeat protein
MVLMNRGLVLIDLDRPDEAIASLNEALQIEPQNMTTLRARGMTFYELGHNDKALADYEKILEINNDAYDVWSNKGLVLAALGKWEEAICAADEGLRLAPDLSDLVMLRLIRAKILFLADRQAQAAEDMVAAWKLDANRVVSLQECRKRLLESYPTLVSPSYEVRLMFAEMSWTEAAVAMAEAEPAQALVHAESASRAFEQLEGTLVANASDSNPESGDQDTASALADDVLERSAARLAEFRDQEFSQWLLSRVGRQDAEAA